ncbi:uncharacterized protein LOC134696534 [Mytilus trossulus]|uniref:uncharacterized protein LOC134696534 n=1 Tax=Mytilus trossulus TaxID=6551 RepID=UPI003004D896
MNITGISTCDILPFTQSETLTITDATYEVTTDTTHEATPTTPAVTLNTTKEQITVNTTTKSTTESSTVSSSIIKLKDERPDYTWIAYVVVGALLLPLAVVSIVNCIRVRRDDTQEKETLDKA